MLPSITPKMVCDRMTMAWTRANVANHQGWSYTCSQFMREYDYLSHYMTSNQVEKIMEQCS